MIEELTIRNYALVEHATIHFDKSFVVMSGETGAGKSLLAGALRLLFGAKSDVSMIRDDADEAIVAGVFFLPDLNKHTELKHYLNEHGIVSEDGRVVIRRILRRSGRGSVLIQSVPATLPELGELCSLLIDMHSQHEHQSLFSPMQQLRILDRYAGIQQEVNEFEKEFYALSDMRKHYASLTSDNFERELELKRHAIKEINEAQLKEGEEAQLEIDIRRLSQHEKLSDALENANTTLLKKQDSVLNNLRQATSFLETIATIDNNVQGLFTRIQDSFYEIEDIHRELQSYSNKVVYDPDRMQRCTERLRLISELERKYGKSIKDVLSYADEAEQEVATIEKQVHSIAELEKEIAETEKKILKWSLELSKKRKSAAASLEPIIVEILQTLGMPDVRFAICINSRKNRAGQPSCGPRGSNTVEFQLSSNPGLALKALNTIASGGELSRVMLAIKSAFAASDDIPTLIFDEIDSGIGGAVGKKLADHLWKLAEYRQVICITHLASIAARGTMHMKVEKYVRDNNSYTQLRVLSQEERVEEIARMLAGDQQADLSKEHAKFLLGSEHVR